MNLGKIRSQYTHSARKLKNQPMRGKQKNKEVKTVGIEEGEIFSKLSRKVDL